MNKQLTTLLLANGILLFACEAQAQSTLRIGPQVGLNLASASYFDNTYQTKSRAGFEAGVLGSIDFGHISLQPALLFSQKGYYLTSGSSPATGMHDDKFRLNYLTLPVKVIYTPRKDGQGVQFLAGAYLGLLVGGHYERTYIQPSTLTVTAGPIVPNQSPLSYEEYSSQRLDAGFLVGLGYRYKQAQVQANFTWGGPNLAVDYLFKGVRYANPIYRNQAIQFSLAYLLYSKSKT
jgi:hypothetical protein